MWNLTLTMWHMTHDTWYTTWDKWHVTHDFFKIMVSVLLSAHFKRFSFSCMPDFKNLILNDRWHTTWDKWHVTHDFFIYIFLDALASLVLMIKTDSLIDTQIGNWQSLGLLRSIRSHHLKWNITQNAISLKMECHSKWNVTQNGMSLKMECHSK